MLTTPEEILTEIRKYVSSHNGVIPGERAFETATRIKPAAWKGRFWARWTDAIREAGLDPNSMNQRIPDEDLLRDLAEFITILNRFPTRYEINVHARRNEGFPVWDTFARRFGGMNETAKTLMEYARQSGDVRLIELCEGRIRQEGRKLTPAKKVTNGRNAPASLGFVYLKYSPSLRLYKIGKANDPKKRGAAISLLLPEDLVPKHEIRTDCPYLLEKYWEMRFREKKKQGEWYELTAAEVETFKSRREFVFREYFP